MDNNQISVEKLRRLFPWPDAAPNVAPKDQGWFNGAGVFIRWTGPKVKVVVELGTWLGKSARWFCSQCPNAEIICVDHWLGSSEHKRTPEWRKMLPTLYETFLVNMWVNRSRVIPVRLSTGEAMTLMHELAVKPDLLYIDASHDAESVYADTFTALTLFPEAQVFGDDWQHQEVVDGVKKALVKLNLSKNLRTKDRTWWVSKE